MLAYKWPLVAKSKSEKENKLSSHITRPWITTLLQNTSVVSAGKVFLISALQVDTIYTIQKRGLFSIGCCQPILKIIIGIGWLKAADTNKCPADRYPRHYWYRLS
jgi:hypothetical protein